MFEELNDFAPGMGAGIKRTAELKEVLRSFLAQCGASSYEDENDKNILKCYSKLQNGMYVEQEIHVGDSDYVCYTNLSGYAKTEDPVEAASRILAANDVNWELKYGNFEVDGKNGAVRFRSYYEPEHEIRMENLDRLLGEPLWAIENHGHVFRG